MNENRFMISSNSKLSMKLRAKRKSSTVFRQLTGSMRMLPSFIIFGCQRCGTTSLYNYLIDHPCIVPALAKEVGFFNEFYHKGLEWYKIYFPLKTSKYKIKKEYWKNLITGEADPTYVHHPNAPARIKEKIPNVKLIIMLRNPVDRAFSQHWKSVKLERETLSFEEAIKIEPKRLRGEKEKMLKNDYYYSQNYHNFSYLKTGIYVQILKNWLKKFPRKQILVLQSEEFYSDPSKIYKKTLEFLDLPTWKPKQFPKWEHYDDMPKLDDTIRKKLIEYFRPHNEELYKFLGESYNWDK